MNTNLGLPTKHLNQANEGPAGKFSSITFSESFCLASFVCLVGSSLFVRIRPCRLPARENFRPSISEDGPLPRSIGG